MASAMDKQPAPARLSAVAAAGCLPTATRGSQSSYTTLWDTTSDTPSGSSPRVTKRHNAMSSLRVKATIIFVRNPPRPSVVRSRYHCA